MTRNVKSLARLTMGAFAAVCFATGATLPTHAQNGKKPATKPATKQTAKQAARTLFLTPGGVYTKADIKANQTRTVEDKYPDFVPSHDTAPQKGARLCPITNTVANPKLTWVVGGKTYQFCCPPCVAEFVQKAKTNPKSIKAPEAYVKR